MIGVADLDDLEHRVSAIVLEGEAALRRIRALKASRERRMLMPGLIHTEELKVLSTALTQFMETQSPVQAKEAGESYEAHIAQSMLDAIDVELSVRLGTLAPEP